MKEVFIILIEGVNFGSVEDREEVGHVWEVHCYSGMCGVCVNDRVWAIETGHKFGGSSIVGRFVFLSAVFCGEQYVVRYLVQEVVVAVFVGLAGLVYFCHE